jgi:hypothetical protein
MQLFAYSAQIIGPGLPQGLVETSCVALDFENTFTANLFFALCCFVGACGFLQIAGLESLTIESAQVSEIMNPIWIVTVPLVIAASWPRVAQGARHGFREALTVIAVPFRDQCDICARKPHPDLAALQLTNQAARKSSIGRDGSS